MFCDRGRGVDRIAWKTIAAAGRAGDRHDPDRGSARRDRVARAGRSAGILVQEHRPRGRTDGNDVFGGKETNKYLLETTGCGVAVLDFDADGWLDMFLVNGSVLEGFPRGGAPTNHLYRNKRDGTFEDVTAKAGLAQSGWGQGACAGDYDNDGHEDLFVTYWGQNRLYRNRG